MLRSVPHHPRGWMTSVVQALTRSDIHGLHLAICSGKCLRRGLCDSSRLAHTAWRSPSGATRSKPRVWSPLQGCAPWALDGSPLRGFPNPLEQHVGLASSSRSTLSFGKISKGALSVCLFGVGLVPRPCPAVCSPYAASSRGKDRS